MPHPTLRPPALWPVIVALTLVTACSARGGEPRDAAASADWSDPRGAICAARASDDASSDPASPGFGVIQKIFDEDCVSCHAQGVELDLTAGASWSNLVNHAPPPAESCGGSLVVPGDPDASFLYQKLSSPKPCFGGQMPQGEFSADPLPDCVVALVRAWIAGGALPQ